MPSVDIHLPTWAAPFLRPAQWKSMRGGRGSGKSHTAAQIMIMRMAGMLPEYPKAPVRIASCRDYNTNLGTSVKVAVEKYIRELGLTDQFRILNNRIDHINGSRMIFMGVSRDPDSFLSLEDIDVFWMEQAEVLQDEMYKIAPTIRKPGSELFFVWNPNLRTDYCWRRFVINPQPGDVSVAVNFYNNPWWTQELEKTRAYYEKVEPSLYPWMYLGVPNDADADRQVLTYKILSDCVKAYQLGLKPDSNDAPVTDAGLDIAEGGRDKCAFVIRVGPSIEFVDMWPGVAGDLSIAARRAHENTSDWDIYRLYYDASSPMRREFMALDAPYSVRSVAFGGEVGGKKALYEPGRTNEQVFARRNIQMADALRLRANRTVRLLGGDTDIDPTDCLFINPEIPDLESYLSDMTQPIRRTGPATGKWELDKRGGEHMEKSPDRFDATCLAFARESEHGLRVRL